jgi:hypothetical protein
MIILFPCSYSSLEEVDDDYRLEKQIAEDVGFETVLFNYDEFIFTHKPLKLSNSFNESEPCIYRGWMMNVKQYDKFYQSLLKLNLKLVNTKDNYKNAHEFINPYKILRDSTPEIMTFGLNEAVDWKRVKSYFGKFKIKDYVKSVKGFNFPEYFDETYSNVELDMYLDRFKELRGELLTGGIIIKRFVPLKRDMAGNNNEFRCWFYKGNLIHYYRNTNGNASELSDLDVSWVKHLPKLKSNFYTIDVAELRNGGWTVIETGDGQVSGYKDSDKENSHDSLAEYYTALKNKSV